MRIGSWLPWGRCIHATIFTKVPKRLGLNIIYSPVISHIAIEHGPFIIDDLPIKKVIFHSKMLVYQTVPRNPLSNHHLFQTICKQMPWIGHMFKFRTHWTQPYTILLVMSPFYLNDIYPQYHHHNLYPQYYLWTVSDTHTHEHAKKKVATGRLSYHY